MNTDTQPDNEPLLPMDNEAQELPNEWLLKQDLQTLEVVKGGDDKEELNASKSNSDLKTLPTTLLDLPTDSLLRIFGYCETTFVMNLGLVSRVFRHAWRSCPNLLFDQDMNKMTSLKFGHMVNGVLGYRVLDFERLSIIESEPEEASVGRSLYMRTWLLSAASKHVQHVDLTVYVGADDLSLPSQIWNGKLRSFHLTCMKHLVRSQWGKSKDLMFPEGVYTKLNLGNRQKLSLLTSLSLSFVSLDVTEFAVVLTQAIELKYLELVDTFFPDLDKQKTIWINSESITNLNLSHIQHSTPANESLVIGFRTSQLHDLTITDSLINTFWVDAPLLHLVNVTLDINPEPLYFSDYTWTKFTKAATGDQKEMCVTLLSCLQSTENLIVSRFLAEMLLENADVPLDFAELKNLKIETRLPPDELEDLNELSLSFELLQTQLLARLTG